MIPVVEGGSCVTDRDGSELMLSMLAVAPEQRNLYN
jgi:hypothetical protein